MKKNRSFLLIIFTIMACSMLNPSQVDKSWGSGILMCIYGRVINSDTGEGVAGTEIIIHGKSHIAILSTITNENGDFCIKKVPEGFYTISRRAILRTCPEDLIIKSIPDEINVPVRKNIYGLEIVLHKGPAVCGKVFGPDGVTPIKGAAIAVDAWFRGRKKFVYTDEDGRYTARGLVEGKRMVVAEKEGYAIEAASVDLQAGEMVEDVNFILGRGKISVKGKITSADTNQGLQNATIYFIYTLEGPKYSGGFDESDEDGNYSLMGLQEPGKFKVNIIIEEYESIRTEVELKIGENILDFTLQPELVKKKTEETALESSGASTNTQNCQNCVIDENKLEEGQKLVCKNLSENNVYKKCIDADTITCMRNRCDSDSNKRNYVIVCTNDDCKTDTSDSRNNTWGYITPESVNMDEKEKGIIYVCINNNKGSDTKQFEQILVHELFHLCDKQGTEISAYIRGFCSDWRAYQMMVCLNEGNKDNDKVKYYERKASENENECKRLRKNKIMSFQSNCA
ncbi:MAG: carboxypeptidase regulatory-like domain-containing protein [Candidatus Aminicenantes bacterium]|nr:MAG: carboxypeptidase regulatory-like domain-containing protein [Candidatus Aminicenantes bacterium]